MGTDASAIVGYLKQYESQVVVKSGGAQEATSYLRTYMMADDGSALYPLKQGAQGEGAISSRCFAVLNDLPLYLSARGVQGVYGTAVAEQRTIRSVSDAIVPKLSQEADLKNACAVVFEGKYYLAVNGHIYVADGSLTEENGDPAWFFWINVPAQCLAVLNGQLWFGTADGRLCRFAKSEEEHAYLDDTAAIAGVLAHAYPAALRLEPLQDRARRDSDAHATFALGRDRAVRERKRCPAYAFPQYGPVFLPHTGLFTVLLPVHSGRRDVPYPMEAAPQSSVCRAHRQRPAG